MRQDIAQSGIYSSSLCPQHRLYIRFFNLNEKVPPQKRVLCDECDLTVKTRLEEAQKEYQVYLQQQEESVNNQIVEKTRKWEEMRKQIESLRDNMIKHSNELIQKIDYKIEIIKQQLRRKAMPCYTDFSLLTLSELQRVAEELSHLKALDLKKNNLDLCEFKEKERIKMPTLDLAPHRFHQSKLEEFQQKLTAIAMRNIGNFINLDLLHQEKLHSSFQDSCINYHRNLMVGSASRGFIMWRVYQGKLKEIKLYGTQEMINCLLFSRNSNTFISSGFISRTIVKGNSLSDDANVNYVKIWKETINTIDDWRTTYQFQCHQKKITSVLLNWEENQIITGSEDFTIQMWMQINEDWKRQQIMTDHQAGVTALSFNSFQTVFVSSSKDKSLIFWEKKDERSWKQKCKLQNAHDTEIYAVSFIFEDRVASGASEIKIWQTDRLGIYYCSQTLQTNSITKKLIFNPTRGLLLEISAQPSMNIWMKKQNGEVYMRLKLDGNFTGPSISNDGKFIIACKTQENMINYYQIK